MPVTNYELEGYQISGLNKEKIRALSILSLTDSKNFRARREQVIYTALGIGTGTEIKNRSRNKIISNILLNKLRNGLKPLEASKDSQALAQKLLDEEMTPYEVTGIIKELVPDTTGKEMTDIWTKLSIITGIKALEGGSINIDWTQEIKNKSIDPKIKNLSYSLQEDIASKKDSQNAIDVTKIKKKYFENKKHLEASKGRDTNWAEILSNLPHDQAGLVKAMLESTKDNILKEKATRDSLWPSPLKEEVENKRLNNLLQTLGNRPTGRSQRYSRILMDESPDCLPKNLPKPTEAIITESEIAKEKVFRRELKDFQALEKDSEKYNKQWYNLFFKLLKINKIPSKDAKELYKEGMTLLKTFISTKVKGDFEKSKDSRAKSQAVTMFYKKILTSPKALKLFLIKSFLNKDMPMRMQGLATSILAEANPQTIPPPSKNSDQVVLDTIHRLCTLEKPTPAREFNRLILQLVNKLENPEDYKELFLQYPFTKSIALKQLVQKNICRENNTLAIPSRVKDIIDSNMEGKPVELGKTYGPSKLCSLHLASWYSGTKGEKTAAELNAIIEKRLEEGFNLNPQNAQGITPLHLAGPYSLTELLKYGASLKIKNDEGLTPLDTNRNQKILKEESIKKTTLKQISKSPELEI